MPKSRQFDVRWLYVLIAFGVLIIAATATFVAVRHSEGNQVCADHGWTRVDTRGALLCVDDNGVVHRP